MKNSQIIISLSIFLLCSSVLCVGNFDQNVKKGGKPAYILTVKWPYFKNYWGEKYTKSDFPTFDSENFAIDAFQPVGQNFQTDCDQTLPPNQPFSFDKIQQFNKNYLSKYIENFDKDNHATTKDLWEKYGSCYKKTQTQYFSDLATAHQKFNIIKAFKSKGIVPTANKIVKQEQFDSALSTLVGKNQKVWYYCAHFKQNGENGLTQFGIRYLNIVLDANFEAADQQDTLHTYEYCSDFILPPFNL